MTTPLRWPAAVVWIAAAALLVCCPVTAVNTTACLAKLHFLKVINETSQEPLMYQTRGLCDTNRMLRPCGELASSRRAEKHVSRQCASVLNHSRVTPEMLKRASEHAHDGEVFSMCFKLEEGDVHVAHPSNPIVIEVGETVTTFAMCTVPKAGCTRLRSLLHLLTFKSPTATDLEFHRGRPHFVGYPNLWHYGTKHAGDAGDAGSAPGIPTVVVGRDPYARVLSGFLEKLTFWEREPDWWNYHDVYDLIGRPRDQPFTADRDGFRAFLRALNATQEQRIRMNDHFATAMKVCHVGSSGREDLLMYDYAFKLEHMSHWLPCLSDFLGLNRYVWKGWTRKSNSQIAFSDLKDSGCWFRPGQYSCEEYERLVRGSMLELALPGPFEKDLSSQNDADTHVTNAWSHIAEFYDEEIERLVYDYYKTDFELFGYERMTFDQDVTTV